MTLSGWGPWVRSRPWPSCVRIKAGVDKPTSGQSVKSSKGTRNDSKWKHSRTIICRIHLTHVVSPLEGVRPPNEFSLLSRFAAFSDGPPGSNGITTYGHSFLWFTIKIPLKGRFQWTIFTNKEPLLPAFGPRGAIRCLARNWSLASIYMSFFGDDIQSVVVNIEIMNKRINSQGYSENRSTRPGWMGR